MKTPQRSVPRTIPEMANMVRVCDSTVAVGYSPFCIIGIDVVHIHRNAAPACRACTASTGRSRVATPDGHFSPLPFLVGQLVAVRDGGGPGADRGGLQSALGGEMGEIGPEPDGL
jgi:hypothetical protein